MKNLMLLSLVFGSCINIGINTADVRSANVAYNQIISSVSIKYAYCRSLGNTYKTTAGGLAITYCNDDTFDNNRGNYVWTKSVDSCTNLIHFTSCPPSETNFDDWVILVVGSCNISEAYFINSYKPFQGKILDRPKNLSGFSFGCF
ncbi:hypothetical protein LPTSP1_36400 [Leptospira johnsonii]|uniref:Uncharacterized protein n=1 Tax=Leptospira johnsonii TaxID=1917820 RepID=A0A2P2D7L6_9LEPT|nr:hypothetical protein LPTSP1_36400 [Leptospira johnsonii]